MMDRSRRRFLSFAGSSMGAAMFPASIQRALAIPAASETGTIEDVQHVVILMQENRSFDHYFGTLPGVRGFGDRLTIPCPNGATVWEQKDALGTTIYPYHLDMTAGNAQRVAGTPHGFTDAHLAWNHGRFGQWPTFKQRQSMGHYEEAELGWQTALANAFTVCDSYHCGIASSTNPNRLFMFTGTNGPGGPGGGPAIDNTNEDVGPPEDGYTWTTYAERLEAAGISWKVYQDLADNFTDNSLSGFTTFREAFYNDPSSPLVQKGLSSTLTTPNLDGFRNDVASGNLPAVSYIVGPSTYSEHPGPSSPIQGGWYVSEVLDSLTASPEVWARTVLLVMFDENDGFFDHVPPPAAPSKNPDGSLAGASNVSTAGEYYSDGQVFGPGPRVPMWIVSPWSRGGWVNSQVFDHTSIIRFLEQRFGIAEPNISPYRRAMCGDLTTCFNFAEPNDEALPELPSLEREEADAIRASQEALAPVPVPTGAAGAVPVQRKGVRPSRALPYRLSVIPKVTSGVQLTFANRSTVGAVFQVYDQLHLNQIPRRFGVAPATRLAGTWSPALLDLGAYDLWVLGPNGYHRRLAGHLPLSSSAAKPEIDAVEQVGGGLRIVVRNNGGAPCMVTLAANEYVSGGPLSFTLAPGEKAQKRFALRTSGQWYDFTATSDHDGAWLRRVAGRVETGAAGVSDPAMGV